MEKEGKVAGKVKKTVEKEEESAEDKSVKDFSMVSKKIKFVIYLGMFLVFIGSLVLFYSLMFLHYNFYTEQGVAPMYVGLLAIPLGLFFCSLGFTAVGLSPKDVDHRLRLGALIATGLCLLSVFFLLFTINFLFAMS